MRSRVVSMLAEWNCCIRANFGHGGRPKTIATEFESMARRNPLGAIAGAVLIGVLIGRLGCRN
jgi:hypothetical protein